ncbi:MAG: inner membrane protein [Candidatus Parcubacteria bacterium]|jgi:hypothetical protein|nr:inner membrane protein [Candidatus Parcubacteria bacterium]
MPLDIGVGILLSLGVAEYFGAEVTPFLIAFGIVCALLPDIDVITFPLLGKWYHRTHTHYPILYLPLAILAYIFFDPLYATIFTLGVYAHLIHDTFGLGWGIAWLWPVTGRKFLIFPWKGAPGQKGMLATWMPENEPSLMQKQQDTGWVKRYYFRPNPLAFIEYGIFVIALALLVLHFS